MPYGFGVVCFPSMTGETGDWLETMLKAAEKRGIDTTALLRATTTRDPGGWSIDCDQFGQLLRHELGWHE